MGAHHDPDDGLVAVAVLGLLLVLLLAGAVGWLYWSILT